MISKKPYQYLKGWVEFYKLKFKVTPAVLIPRPETELLVDEVLNSIKGEDICILDVGTGSGNIAISVAKNTSKIQIIGTDISIAALKIAKQNAKLQGVDKRIKFIKSDLLKNPIIHTTKYKILIMVTNLPYIPSARIPYLDSSVADFEPTIALDGGDDGFDLYRKLFQQISQRSLKPKLIVGEIDYTQGSLAVHEAMGYFPDAEIEVKTDLAQKQRILLIRQLL